MQGFLNQAEGETKHANLNWLKFKKTTSINILILRARGWVVQRDSSFNVSEIRRQIVEKLIKIKECGEPLAIERFLKFQ